MDSRQENRTAWGISLALALATVAVFSSVTRHGFVNYDDGSYVTENVHVKAGLTWRGLAWAFTNSHSSNWHPVTTLSHMLDCQLFGLNAGWHHAVNLLLHTTNAILLFWLLLRLTGALWRSAFVAALFALHPMHVESVAWVSERKDVLSALFGLLSLGAYANYALAKSRVEGRESSGGSPPEALASRSSTLNYRLALFFFALGLMSKPMLVTWPFVLLLLDFWPLRRLDSLFTLRHSPGLLREKIPFLALSAASCLVTFLVQKSAGAVQLLAYISIPHRLINCVVAYARYVGKTFWPVNLSAFYPLRDTWPAWQVAVAAAVLLLLTALAILRARQQPQFFFGWFWFVGTLVPVIGLVQVGSQAIADRYTYIPYVGLFIGVVWTLADFVSGRPVLKWVTVFFCGASLAASAITARVQVRYWADSVSLFRHALAVTEENQIVHLSLGTALCDAGQVDEGVAHLQAALRLNDGFVFARGKLAHVLAAQGKTDEAVEQYQIVVKQSPDLPEALNNLAWLFATHADAKYRNGAEAVRLAEHACELTGYKTTIYIGTLAAAYAEAGRFDDAART